jgi:hypothetical protein
MIVVLQNASLIALYFKALAEMSMAGSALVLFVVASLIHFLVICILEHPVLLTANSTKQHLVAVSFQGLVSLEACPQIVLSQDANSSSAK